MISFLSVDSPLRDMTGSPVSRVRVHLKIGHGKREGAHQREPRRDFRTLLARLSRVRRRGGSFLDVELGPELAAVTRAYQVVGNEMLMLVPERRGA